MGRAPNVVAVIPSYIASCQINVIKPLQQLARRREINFKHSLEHRASHSLIDWADLIVFCRNTEPAFNYLLAEALMRRKPVIYDLDDSFWDIPATGDTALARYHKQPLRLRQLEHYLSSATIVRVYSPLLQKKVEPFNLRARIYRSAFDFSLVPQQKLIRTDSSFTEKNADDSLVTGNGATSSATLNRGDNEPITGSGAYANKIKIVYATSRTIDDQYRLFLPGIEKFLSKYSDRVEMTIWGCAPSELLKLQSVVHRKLVSEYEQFLKEFSRTGFDIGLAPLDDSEFSRSKNNTKFRDYGACQIAGIYSNVDVYSASVVNGETGLLVNNESDSWFHALERLTLDEQLRMRIKSNAHEFVRQQYRQELIEQEWINDINELIASSPRDGMCARPSWMDLPVVATEDQLSGATLSFKSFGEELNMRWSLEIRSSSDDLLRGVSTMMRRSRVEENAMTFSFPTIENSKNQKLTLRLVPLERCDAKLSTLVDSVDVSLDYA
jgi:hypothetical protein